jgi:hypothetical protein
LAGLFRHVSNEGASETSGRSADRGTANIACNDSANDRTRCRTDPGTLLCRRTACN